MSYQEANQDTSSPGGRLARFFATIVRLFRGVIRLFHFGSSDVRTPGSSTYSNSTTSSAASQPAATSSTSQPIGAVQTMIASPQAVVVEQSPQQVTVSAIREVEVQEDTGNTENEQYSDQLYVRPKIAPPLPPEHRAYVKKWVKAGSRKKAEEKLEELGYLFPEVSTRGSTVVVKYRGYDGYLYASKFRYK